MAIKQPALILERERRKKKKESEVTPKVNKPTKEVVKNNKGTTHINRATISTKPSTQNTTQNRVLTNKERLTSKPTISNVNKDIRTVKTSKNKSLPKKSIQTVDVYERGGNYYYKDGKKEKQVDTKFIQNALNNNRSGVIGRYNSKGKLVETDERGNVKALEKNVFKKAGRVAKGAYLGAKKGFAGIADAAMQETRNDLQKGEKIDSYGDLAKNEIKALIHAMNPTLGRNAANKEAGKNIRNIWKDEDKTLWQKIVGTGLETINAGTVGDIQGLKESVRGIGAVDHSADEKVKKVQEKIDEPINKQLEKFEQESDKYDKTTNQIAKLSNIVGNMIPGVATSVVTKNPTLGLATMGLSAKGQSTERAEMAGADLDTATKMGTAGGWTEVGTELLTGGVPIFGKGALDDIFGNLINSKIKSKGANFVTKKILGTVGEEFEEVLSDLAGVMIDRGTIDPNAKYTLDDFLETAKDTFGSTFILNLLTGGYGGRAYRSNIADMQNYKTQQANEVAQRVNSGEIDAQEGNALLEQVKDGTYQQNRNLEQIATQESQKLKQAAQQGQITPQQYTQELQTLTNTVNQTREEINGTQQENKKLPHSSKVNDVGYHASNKTFESYDISKIGTGQGDNTQGKGINLASVRDAVDGIYGKNTYETNINLENAYTVNDKELLSTFEKDFGYKTDMDNISDELKKKGYDGIVINVNGNKLYTVFDSKNAKITNNQQESTQESTFNNEDEETKKAKETFRNIKTKEDMDNLISNLKDKVDNIKTGEDLKNTFKEIYDIYKVYNKSNAIYEVVEKDGLYGTRFESEFYNPDIKYKPLNEEIKIQKVNLENWLRIIKDDSEKIIYNNQDKVTPKIGKNIDSLDKVTPITTDDFKNKLHDYIDKETEDIKGKFESNDGHLFRDGREVRYLYRAIDQAEMDSIKNNGYIKSNQSKNIGYEIEQGLTDFKDNYPGFYLPRNADGYIIKIEVKPENGFFYDFDEYAKTPNEIPANQIVEINGEKIKSQQETTSNQQESTQEVTDNNKIEENKTKAKESYRDYDKEIRELEDNQYDLEEYIKDNEDYHSDNEEIEAEYQRELNEKKNELETVNKKLSELQEKRETQYLKEIQELPNPTKKTEFEGFSSTDTDFPFANEILNAKGEERKNILKHEKLRDAYVVEMTPKEYLENAGKYGWNSILSYEEISKQMGERNQKNIDEMAEAIKKGDKLPMPYLEIGADSHNQEGRHRAFAAEKAGLKTIPVLIMEKNTKLIDDTAPKKSENIPATKSENVITIKNDNLKGVTKDKIKGEDTGVSINGKQVQMQIPIDSKPNKLGQYVPKDGFTKKELKSGKLGDSKFYKNVTERADFIRDEVREKVKDDDYVKHYRKVTNDESMQEAFNDLNTRGTEAIADFFNKQEELTAKDTAMGWLLIEQSQANGDYDFSTQVLRKLRSNATKTAQTLQMYNYYARLTPEGMYKWCGDQLLRAEEIFEKNKTKKWIEANKKRWQLNTEETNFIKSQMERVQELNKMDDNDITTIEIGKKGKTKEVTVERAKQVEIAKIQAMIENKIPPEKGKAINAWMRISMLGNLKTIGTRNPMGNIALRPINDVGDIFASAADFAISKVTGVRTKGTFNAKAQAKGFVKGGSETFQDARLGINTRNSKGNRFEIGEGKAFNEQHQGVGKVLNPLSKAGNYLDSKVSFLLDLGDRPFYEASYQQSLENQMRLNGITKLEDVPDWMKKVAEQEGFERTYQDDNNYTQSVIAIRNAMNTMFNVKGYGLGDVIIPFAKTPANITKAIVDYSPAGFVSAITKGKNLKNSIQNGQFTPEMQHAFVNQLGKATAGTILYAIGAALSKAGITTGGDDEDKDLADFMKNTLGIQPYSIKVGDKSYTYDWAQPVASGLAIPADIRRGIQDAKEGEVDLQYIIHNAFASGGKVLLEQSFLQGIKDVLGGYGDPLDNLMSEIEGLPARAVPTLFQQIVTCLDGTKRMSYGNKGTQNVIAQAQAKTLWAKDLPVYRNSLGKEVKMYGGKNNFFNVFINPANYSQGNATETAKEIYRVYQATNDKTVLPRLVDNKTKNEDGKNLTNQQKSDFLKISGDIIEENVERMMNEKKYQDMSDDEKAEKIKAIVGYSYNKARKEITGHKLSGAHKKAEQASESGYSIADYFLNKTKQEKKKTTEERNRYMEMKKKGIDGKTFDEFKAFALSARADKTRNGGYVPGSKKQKIIDYIQGLPLSAKQKQALWEDYQNNTGSFQYYK